MYETTMTVIGTVITEPRRRMTPSGEEVCSFRVASNSRRVDRSTGEWVDGPTLYLTVSCWRRLLAGVSQAIAKGRPVIVHGMVKTNDYVTNEGEKRSDLEMTASAVGLDLSRCVALYQGVPAADAAVEAQPAAATPEGVASGENLAAEAASENPSRNAA